MKVPNSDDGVKHFTNDEPHLLSEILCNRLSVNTKDFKVLLQLGAIYINNERQTKDKFILECSDFRVHTKPRRYNCEFSWSSLIVFENDFFLVLNKPSGIPSHPAVDNLIENSLTQTSLARNYPLYVTHRLDTLTSGLIVYAKKQNFVKSFNLQLQQRAIKKKYVALVESAHDFPLRLTHYMDPALGAPKKLSLEQKENWPICELEILAQKEITSKLTWVKLNLLTGRTHQIRAQLSSLQAPILGDYLYGAKMPFQKNAIALKSYEIEFSCNNQPMHFSISEEFDF